MDEEKLVDQSKKGDRAAMDALVELNWERIFHHCLRIVQDEGAAQDLTQETFVKAFEHLDSFKQHAKFSTWVWRIAHNLSINYLKKQRIKEQPLKEEVIPSPELEQESEFIEQLNEALKTLDEKHRIVFELYDLKHIPQKEIGAQLDIPHGTVRSRLHYAREQIREYFKRFPPEA